MTLVKFSMSLEEPKFADIVPLEFEFETKSDCLLTQWEAVYFLYHYLNPITKDYFRSHYGIVGM